jgi:hypothetical protein
MTTSQNKKAFPFSRKEYVVVEDSINEVEVSQDGMDLRDYFAAKALNGMLSTENWFGSFSKFKSVDDMTSRYAEEAYLFADAMLKARGQ